MARSLIVLPDDSAKPILEAIESASRTLRVKMFVFSDSSLLKVVIAARRRGVNVKVMLNPARRNASRPIGLADLAERIEDSAELLALEDDSDIARN
jgi:phosphatidylserine/phosphatidylglycerophosphate/cardiolipin synthase-like enzyme